MSSDFSEEVSDFLERYIFQPYGSVIKIPDDVYKKIEKCVCLIQSERYMNSVIIPWRLWHIKNETELEVEKTFEIPPNGKYSIVLVSSALHID